MNIINPTKLKAALASTLELLKQQVSFSAELSHTPNCSPSEKGNIGKDNLANFDWFLPDAPDEIPLQSNQRLVAIGDIHGNIQHLVNVLEFLGQRRRQKSYRHQQSRLSQAWSRTGMDTAKTMAMTIVP